MTDERRRRFEALMLPHLDAAYRLARWHSRSDKDAEDIAQDAYLRAYRLFDGFRGTEAKPWLFAIIRNCARNHASRKRKNGVAVSLSLDGGPDWPDETLSDRLESTDESPEDYIIRTDMDRHLQAALAALPDEAREILVFREFEDMSYRDIARVIGIPVGTVMSRLSRAREMLRMQLIKSKAGPVLP